MPNRVDNIMELEQTGESLNSDKEISVNLGFQPENSSQEEQVLIENLDGKQARALR
jgi:hypothetical protein